MKRSGGIIGRDEKGVKEPASLATDSQLPCASQHQAIDARTYTDKTLSDCIDSTLTPETSRIPTQPEEMPLRLTTKEQDQAMLLPHHRQNWSVPRALDPVTEHSAFHTLGHMRDTDYFGPSQMRYSQSARCYLEEDVAPQASARQQQIFHTLAHREIATTPSHMADMHHQARGARCQEAHGSHRKVEESYERPWNFKHQPFRTESRKRKRILSNEEQQMKPPINTQISHDNKSKTFSPTPEGATSQRFCPICDSTHCHHINKEQTLSPTVPPVSNKVGERKFFGDNSASSSSAHAFLRAQRRHTADICHQSMQVVTCTAPGPRRSLQFEHGAASSQVNSPTSIDRLPNMSLMADSGYSTAAATSPGTQTSRSRTHDPASGDEEVQQITTVLSKTVQHTRSSSMIPGTPTPASQTFPFLASSFH